MLRIVLAAAAISCLLTCLLASNSASADYRTFKILEKSYELMLDKVTLPNGTAGTLIFKECDSCDARSIGVNAATQYFLDGHQMTLADLHSAVEKIRAADADVWTGVYVHYAIDTLAVNRIQLIQFPPRP